MSVARNVVFNPMLVPGGDAVEMAISVGLHVRVGAVTGVDAGPFRAVTDALEVVPHTPVQNTGGNAIIVQATREERQQGQGLLQKSLRRNG